MSLKLTNRAECNERCHLQKLFASMTFFFLIVKGKSPSGNSLVFIKMLRYTISKRRKFLFAAENCHGALFWKIIEAQWDAGVLF